MARLLLQDMAERLSDRLHTRSVVLQRSLESRTEQLALGWLMLVSLACALRILVSPLAAIDLNVLAPYMLLAFAPVASFLLALKWFAGGEEGPQPSFRLARVGRWRDLSSGEAKRHKLYGTSGIMLSLLVGMLLNVPVRTAEYLMTMPAIGAAAPEWLASLHFALTLDTVLLGSLYVVAFAMALRRHALFPRFLLMVWLLDLLSQVAVAKASAVAGLPLEVAASLQSLLMLNMQKVMISMALWLPYLILSTRVNVTFRHRVPA